MTKKISKEMNALLKEIHNNDFDGGGWGAAVSTPYLVVRYLSKEFSDKILNEVYASYDEAKKAFDSIPASKRLGGGFPCKSSLCEALSKWDMSFGNNGIKIPIDGDYIEVLFLSSIYCKNGHYKAIICDRDVSEFKFKYKYNGFMDRSFRFNLFWDPEKNLFYVIRAKWTGTNPIHENERRRNWCRGKKRTEFLRKCKELRENLMKDGIELTEIKKIENGKGWGRDEYKIWWFDSRELNEGAEK